MCNCNNNCTLFPVRTVLSPLYIVSYVILKKKILHTYIIIMTPIFQMRALKLIEVKVFPKSHTYVMTMNLKFMNSKTCLSTSTIFPYYYWFSFKIENTNRLSSLNKKVILQNICSFISLTMLQDKIIQSQLKI